MFVVEPGAQSFSRLGTRIKMLFWPKWSPRAPEFSVFEPRSPTFFRPGPWSLKPLWDPVKCTGCTECTGCIEFTECTERTECTECTGCTGYTGTESTECTECTECSCNLLKDLEDSYIRVARLIHNIRLSVPKHEVLSKAKWNSLSSILHKETCLHCLPNKGRIQGDGWIGLLAIPLFGVV